MNKKCSKCPRTPSGQSVKKDVRIKDSKVISCHSSTSKQLKTTDYEKPEGSNKRSAGRHSTEKLGCSCKKSRSQVKTGGAPPLKLDFKKSANDVKVDVSPIFAESTSSGGISIPVKLMVSVKRSQKQISNCQLFRDMLLVKPPPQLVYNSYTLYAYCDPYLDEMADIFDAMYSSHAADAAGGGNEFMDTSGTNCYVEPYTVFGYTRASQESVAIQTDLVLGTQLESNSLESFKNDSNVEITETATPKSGKDPEMPWPIMVLVTDIIGDNIIRMDKPRPDDTVATTTIIPCTEPTQKIQKSGCSPCSRCCDVIIPDPPIIPEIEFVFSSNCWKTEPYIYPLRHYSPVIVVITKGMSWDTLVVPPIINLRNLGKSPCTCPPKPKPKFPELKCNVCKMTLRRSAPALHTHKNRKEGKPCAKCAKSTSSIMSPSTKNSENIQGGVTKTESGRCKEGSKAKFQSPKMEVLYKSDKGPPSKSGADNFCATCDSAIPAEYAPCGVDDPKAYCERPDPVLAALQAFETELKPMKCTLNMVQQKLKNLNMPELDFMLNKPVPNQSKLTKIKLKSESIRLLYQPGKKPTQSFGKVKRRSKSRSRSKSCSRCPSTASCKSKKSSSKRIKCPKHKSSKDKRHKKRKSSKTSSQKSNCSKSSTTEAINSCFCSSQVVARPSDKSTTSSCACKVLLPSSSTKKTKKNSTRVRSLRIRSKNYTKTYSRSSSQDSDLSECPFLEAIKSILVDRQQITQQNCGQNNTQMSRNVENIRLHLRLQPKKKKNC